MSQVILNMTYFSYDLLSFTRLFPLSRTVPRDALTQTTPPVLIGRLHSHDFRSNCIINHDLTPSCRLRVSTIPTPSPHVSLKKIYVNHRNLITSKSRK